jgi:hypothetical protein
VQIAIVEQLHAVEEIFQSGDVDENSQFFYQSPPHSSKYFFTSTKIASATVFLVPGFGMRAISFATSTASGGKCAALSVRGNRRTSFFGRISNGISIW